MLSAPMCELSLLELSSAPISADRDQRLQMVKAGTVARELSLIHNVIDVARRLLELIRWMPPFIGHRMMLNGAMAAPEGGAYGKCTHAVDRPGEAQLPSLRD